LKYQKTNMAEFIKKMSLSFGLACAFTIAIGLWMKIEQPLLLMLLRTMIRSVRRATPPAR
jgi:hypothetical protein